MSYQGFKEYGLNIVAGFDLNVPDNYYVGEKPVFSMERLPLVCKRLNIKLGIITVPSQAAQEVCDTMVACGIQAIWSFAPTHLVVPEGILVRNENMAFSLAMLSKHLKEKMFDDLN